MTETNGRPGWRDVLYAVEHSEERLSQKIDDNSQKIQDIDRRTKRLESYELVRQDRDKQWARHWKTLTSVIAAFAAAVAAFVGLGFL